MMLFWFLSSVLLQRFYTGIEREDNEEIQAEDQVCAGGDSGSALT